MKSKNVMVVTYFILFSFAYIIDLITTIIALSMGAVEANPIAVKLFSIGPISGVFLVFLYSFFLAIIMWLVVELVYFVYCKWTEEDIRFYAILLAVALLIIFFQEILAVINNLNVIFSLKGG